ncbi:hypothetical protein C3L33_00446, partial [Rhododendron williamsianum]
MKSFNSLLVSFFLLFYTTNAFNITHILGKYPDFSTFNNYLTQTQLAAAINSRQTLTILAVDNAGISPLSGKPADELKKILSVHVVLDYFDDPKLKKLSKKTSLLTTLFQSSGQATGQQGFVNVTNLSTGSVVFGSGVKGSALGANLVKSVDAEPYNISVLQISTVIIPPGIDGSTANSSTNSTAKSPQASPAPGPASVPPTKSPKKSPPTAAPQPSEAAPPPNATADSPAKGDADVPTADAPAKDDKKSAGVALRLGVFVVLVIAVSTSFIGLVF